MPPCVWGAKVPGSYSPHDARPRVYSLVICADIAIKTLSHEFEN